MQYKTKVYVAAFNDRSEDIFVFGALLLSCTVPNNKEIDGYFPGIANCRKKQNIYLMCS